MDLQFRKDLMPYLRTIANEVESREQTQEVRLPDGMPDIGHVLASHGQVLVRGKEWRPGGIGVNGGIMVWVLYAPEDASGLQCVETWIPFQMKWDMDTSASDGIICAVPMLEGVDARSASARKLMVRANLGMMLQAKQADEADLYLPDDIPEDVCILQNTYPMRLPAEGGEKAFSLEETMDLPASMPTPEKLLYYDICASAPDQRILTDKLVFRGSAVLCLAYLDGEEKLHKWSCEIPFSQYAELKRDYSDNADSSMQFAVTNLELEKAVEGHLTLKTGLLGQYTIYDRTDIPVVEDAYSPKRDVKAQMAQLRLPAVLDSVSETIHAQKPMEQMDGILSNVMFYPSVPRMYHDSDGISVTLSGTFHGLREGMDGQLQGTTKQWEQSWELPAAPGVRAEFTVHPANVGSSNGNLEADLQLQGNLISDREIPAVMGLELGELGQTDPNRPSLILRRMGDLSLWELAKSAGSTVEAIKKANGFVQEPDPGQMLLIPVQ